MQQPQGKKIAKVAGCSGCGCGIGLVAFIATILYLALGTNMCARMNGKETYPITGEPSKFDPYAAIPEIRAKVGAGAVLVDFEATSVRPDGTMDLKATYSPPPRATYTFQIKLDKAPDGEIEPPIGAGRGPEDVWVQQVTVKVYEPGKRSHITTISGNSRSSYTFINEGMDVDRSKPRMTKLRKEITGTKINPKAMWEIAKKLDAPENSVASVNISDNDADFSIIGVKLNLRWDEKGELGEFWLSDEQREKLGIKKHRP